MKLSSLARIAIKSQHIEDDGKLVTMFDRAVFEDGTDQHPAGTLTNEPVTDNRGLDAESVYSMSCTRTVDGKKIVVWDEGYYCPHFDG